MLQLIFILLGHCPLFSCAKKITQKKKKKTSAGRGSSENKAVILDDGSGSQDAKRHSGPKKKEGFADESKQHCVFVCFCPVVVVFTVARWSFPKTPSLKMLTPCQILSWCIFAKRRRKRCCRMWRSQKELQVSLLVPRTKQEIHWAAHVHEGSLWVDVLEETALQRLWRPKTCFYDWDDCLIHHFWVNLCSVSAH